MTWTHAYRAYDDDTLATLANAGLLRRAAKDAEAGKVQWQRQGDTDGVVQADGQQVQLDARGPQNAQCDCPAPGLCKHILAAALWLRALPEGGPEAAVPEAVPDQAISNAPIPLNQPTILLPFAVPLEQLGVVPMSDTCRAVLAPFTPNVSTTAQPVVWSVTDTVYSPMGKLLTLLVLADKGACH